MLKQKITQQIVNFTITLGKQREQIFNVIIYKGEIMRIYL